MGQNTLNFYLIITMVYSYYNISAMKIKIGSQREAKEKKKMACFIFKNTYYLVMLTVVIICKISINLKL